VQRLPVGEVVTGCAQFRQDDEVCADAFEESLDDTEVGIDVAFDNRVLAEADLHTVSPISTNRLEETATPDR
jgi:hypothetical protein